MKRLSIACLSTALACLLASCGGGEGGSAAPTASLAAVMASSGLLLPDCAALATSCAALSPSAYSGTGIGIWRYRNDSDTAATLDINMAGVTAGKVATLVFSNASESLTARPDSGKPAPVASRGLADAKISLDAAATPPEQAHGQMLERNRLVSAGLVRRRSRALSDLSAVPVQPGRLWLSPAVGATRSWLDNFPASPVAYSTSAQFICALPSGRKVVWWVDPTIVSSGKFTAAAWSSALGELQASYCGASGGLARLNALLGDVWGAAAASQATVIQETANSLQDVNVVLLNVPASTQWAGYFYGGNNLLKSASASSNEALAFFINADQVKSDLKFSTSTLMHESTHMVNFYQRTIARNVVHDTWLEETAAMMTEDIVTPAVAGGYNKILSYRLPIYLATGANVSYINWENQSDASPNYALGGGFGAFLNRRYGLAIYRQLVTGCNDGLAGASSYACLDTLIKANGGAGFADEFERFGITALGQLPPGGLPAGYGYPAVQAGDYLLQAADLSDLSLAPAAPLGTRYLATSHTYQQSAVGAGQTRYLRSGVVVPARTSLALIIK